MNKKLTLWLDETVISQAKNYAKHHKETLSGMVEKYFEYVTSINTDKRKARKIPRDIKELIGIISIPENLDIKMEYRQRRTGKALHE